MNSEDLLHRLQRLETQVELLTRLQGNGQSTQGLAEDLSPEITEAQHSQALAHAIDALQPLRPLLDDPMVNDILINGPAAIYVERDGRIEKTALTFPSEHEVFLLAKAIAAQTGREVSHRRPIADARLMDGSRVNVIAPPAAVDGTAISIRKFGMRDLTLENMAEQQNLSLGLAQFLGICGKCRINMIVSGGTGSGKTTLLNAISRSIPVHERIVTIEDAAELRLQQPHVVRLETRPIPRGGSADDEITMRDLMKNALRMRPDRILIGEVRGPEAFDMMQAMNTGHEGSLTSIHANHPRDALSRLENMVTMTNFGLPSSSIKGQIASAVQLIVQISRMRDGFRRVTYVSEIVGMESDIITMQDLFTFMPKGESKDGRVVGDFKWSGIVPRFLRRIAYYGEADNLAQALGTTLPRF